MNYTESIPGFSNTDRLGLTAFGSILLHVVIILGIGFTAPKVLPRTNALPTLDIVLVNTRSDEVPKEADYLAQSSQAGGGDRDRASIARSPLPANPAPNAAQKVPQARLATRRNKAIPAPRSKLLLAEQADKQVASTKPRPRPDRRGQLDNKLGLEQRPQRESERQRLSAEISRDWQEYLKRPRRKFLSARTKEYKYAAYMQAWVIKVERIGNLHYPKWAKRQKLKGSAVLDVQLKADGSVLAIDIKRSSGQKLLDDAAVSSIRLAAPFNPFPDNIRREVDILHITRTWQYRGTRLVSR